MDKINKFGYKTIILFRMKPIVLTYHGRSYVRDHVTVQFLNINELQALRDEMDHTKQIAFEPTPQFARRFRDIAEAAYPKNDRTTDDELIVIKGFARGLTSDSLARKLVEEIVPTTLDDAINVVARLYSRRDAYDRLGRNEEPMEVTAVRANDSEKLSKMVEKLSTKLAKMELATHKLTATSKQIGPLVIKIEIMTTRQHASNRLKER